MSEMRRLAQLLVASRPAVFESHHSLEASRARLRSAAQTAGAGAGLRASGDEDRVRLVWARAASGSSRVTFDGRWTTSDGRVRLEGEFAPTRRAGLVLKATSAVLTALLAACAYAFLAPEVDLTTRVALPITTAMAILGFPFIAVALGAQREAEEAQITRAVRLAFAKEGEVPAPAPRQKWDDEED